MEYITLLKLGLAAYYLTSVFLFDMEDIGPFPSSNVFVRNTVEGFLAHKPVDLFDRFRYLFGAYTIQADSEGRTYWFVRSNFMLVWVCPACLGFWITIALYFFGFFVPQGQPIIDILAAAGVVLFLSVVRR